MKYNVELREFRNGGILSWGFQIEAPTERCLQRQLKAKMDSLEQAGFKVINFTYERMVEDENEEYDPTTEVD